MTVSEHYELTRANGSSFWESTEEGGFLSIPSVFLAHRESHDDVTPDGGRRGGGSALLLELMPVQQSDDGSGLTETPVATVTLSFTEPGSDEVITDQIEVVYPRAPWVVEPEGLFISSLPEVIHKSFVMLNILVGIQSACQVFHLGAPEEALGMLRRLLAAVEDYNEELEDVDMDYDIALIEQLIAVIEANGGEEPEDLEVPADPWPAD